MKRNDGDSLGAIFWKNVERLKNNKHLTWNELYERVGVSKAIRTTKIQNRVPQAKNLEKFVEFFGVDKSELFKAVKEDSLSIDERRDKVIKKISEISIEKLEIIEKIIKL